LVGWRQVHEVDGGDHSLKVKGGKEAAAAAVSAACKAAVAFVREVAEGGAGDGAGSEQPGAEGGEAAADQPAAETEAAAEGSGHVQKGKRKAVEDPRSTRMRNRKQAARKTAC
jgi:hypothetical protein